MKASVLILPGMNITVHAEQVSETKVTSEIFKDLFITDFWFVNILLILCSFKDFSQIDFVKFGLALMI